MFSSIATLKLLVDARYSTRWCAMVKTWASTTSSPFRFDADRFATQWHRVRVVVVDADVLIPILLTGFDLAAASLKTSRPLRPSMP